jgi:hypothetical protein
MAGFDILVGESESDSVGTPSESEGSGRMGEA